MPTLDFKGKQLVYAHHLTVPSRTLEPDPQKSLPQQKRGGDSPGVAQSKGQQLSLDDNLIIHGDNLHELKALMPRYAGKIKCIYIAPPYNTEMADACLNSIRRRRSIILRRDGS